ncbi:MAG: hypothetical protein CW691_04695 [Candidatus Bathyarchaeum sp.]|nr:MAG: hypothetical protein CW691_04695 [Candidatus Bathyarchaeum sp.]
MLFGDEYVTDLCDLGLSGGEIGETIVSTYSMDGQPSAAPMGVVIKNSKQLIIRPYVSSLTYKNLQATRCAVVNVTSDPELFYMTAFKEVNPDRKLPFDMFEKAETVDAPRLRGVDALVEVLVSEIGSFSSERAEFLCNAQLVNASKALPMVYCRARFATIEAIIHATRIQPFLSGTKQEQKRAIKLQELVNVCQDVVDRTAPDSCYSEVMADLTQRINSWRKKSESLR